MSADKALLRTEYCLAPSHDSGHLVHARRALVVDGDPAACQLLARSLARHGFDVVQAAGVSEAEILVHRHRPEILIIDVALGAGSGIELVRMLKGDGRTSTIPVIVTTERLDEEDRLRGFEAGADDCVIKPIPIHELMARIRAILRRVYRNEPNGLMQACGLELNSVSHQVTFCDRIVELGPLRSRLLSYLMSHPDKVLTRTMILTHVWDEHLPRDLRVVDTQVKQLRHLLKAYHCERCIQTVYGVGYRFSTHVLH